MKNPWMSAWLSAANSMSGAARGQMAAEARRSQNAMLAEMTRQTMALWFPAVAAPPKRRKPRRSST